MNPTPVTPEALDEAAARFDQLKREKDAVTCRSMAMNLRFYGSFKTEKQAGYAANLVEWSKPRPAQQPQTPRTPDANLKDSAGFKRVAEMFAVARSKGLAKARIDIVVSTDDGVVPLVLKPVSPGGRNPEGTIYVNCGATKDYLGKVMPDGQFYRAGDCGDDEFKALTAFAQDPVGISRASGRLTSNCCFCRKKLTTPESVAVGYGPSCAKSYGLVWGDDLVETKVQLKNAP